jgi:large subunit ribosomal protein L10
MARPEKEAEVLAIAEKLQAARSVVLADFTGLTVEKLTAFRASCRGKSVECRVVKNRLAKIAAGKADLAILQDYLSGPTALILGPQSQVDPAKLAVEFAKENEALRIKGGIVDGRYIDAAEVEALSRVPGREQLLAMIMGSMQAPARGLACTIQGVTAALARAIDAVAKQKAA